MNNKLIHILLADVTPIRVCLGLAALLFAFGLLYADVSSGGYEMMMDHAHRYVWVGAFTMYAVAKFNIILYNLRNRILLYSTVLLGCYLWLFTFLSFANSPVSATSASDLLILLLVFTEVWVGASTLSLEEHK
jgi:hypothetical protein